jgi:signal transduction histidine kinase
MASQFQLPFSRAGRSANPHDAYLVLVALAGLLVGGWLLWLLRNEAATFSHADGTFWLTFWLLAACALPAEIVRFPTWHRGGQAWLTMSRPFVLALLVGWGAPLAAPVFAVASVASDLIDRKGPALRIAFNAGQYVLCIAAAGATYTALGGERSLALRHVPAFLAATVVLYMVNRLLVRVAVALHNQHPMTLSYLMTYNPLIELAEGAVQFSWVLVALLVAGHRPLLVIMLAAPAPVLFLFGRAAEQLQALKARRRGPAGELGDLEQRGEAVLRMAELERVRLAADLHDGPVQRIQQLVRQIQMVQANIAAGNPNAAKLLHQVEDEVTAESRNLRGLVAELRPPVLQRHGLAGALTHLAEEFQTTCGIVCTVQADPAEGLSEELEVLLYRVTQEALTNVARHAHASHVRVTVAVDDGVARLQVHDDGTGFDPQLVQEDGHYGLALMRERVELALGVFQVDSMPGRGGTTITVKVQVQPAS